MTPTPQTSPNHHLGALPDAVERVSRSVLGLAMRRGAASAVVWRPGVAVTAASALWRHSQVAVVLPNGEQVTGEIRGADGSTDLAVVTFTGDVPAATTAAPAEPRVGEFVFAVGREPSGRVQASFGHVGAAGGEWRTWRGGRVERLIRLDGGLYPGLAGAPVANASGEVLGVASPALSRMHGVVLPVATVERVLTQLLAHGRVPHGYLGIAAQPVRSTLDGVATVGLLISSVAEDGPAAAAGLMVGDILLSVGGLPVDSLETLRELLGQRIGQQLPLVVARGGQRIELTLQVAQRPSRSCH